MIECGLAWTFLFYGVAIGDPLYVVASGLFAVASQIHDLREEKRR